jgi:hypothetical protein
MLPVSGSPFGVAATDGTLLVSNFDSGQVEAVDVATVPGASGTAG